MSWLRCCFGSTGTNIEYIGTYTGNRTIDVSSYKKSRDTVSNFLVELSSTSVRAGNSHSCSDTDNNQSGGSTFSKSLSGNNLVISGTTANTTNGNGYVWGNCTITYKVYHV